MATKGNALAKYQSVLKRVRREHPNMKFSAAQKEASRLLKSKEPVKKRTGTTAKRKRITARPKLIHRTSVGNVTRSKPRAKASRPRSAIQRANALISKIERLEVKRRNATAKIAKDIIQLEINKCHDSLDCIKRAYKKK